nr:conserved exported hypothetical protein [Vibrio chagasii]
MLKKIYAASIVSAFYASSAIGAQQELTLTLQSSNHETRSETFRNRVQSSIGFRHTHELKSFSIEMDASYSSIRAPDISYKQVYTNVLLSPPLGSTALINFKAGFGAITIIDVQSTENSRSLSTAPTITGAATINKTFLNQNFYLSNILTSTIGNTSFIESSTKYECFGGVKKGRFDYGVGYKKEKLNFGKNLSKSLSSDGVFISAKVTF